MQVQLIEYFIYFLCIFLLDDSTHELVTGHRWRVDIFAYHRFRLSGRVAGSHIENGWDQTNSETLQCEPNQTHALGANSGLNSSDRELVDQPSTRSGRVNPPATQPL